MVCSSFKAILKLFEALFSLMNGIKNNVSTKIKPWYWVSSEFQTYFLTNNENHDNISKKIVDKIEY